MEAFLRYARETRDARAPDYRPHPLASPVTPSPTDRTTLAFSSRVPRANNLFVHPLNRSETRRDLGLEEYYPRFMAQGMDDVDEVRTSRQLDTVLETVGMDCNPGYVVAPEMRSDEMPSHVVRFLFFFSAFALRSRRSLIGAARSSSRLLARRSAPCFRTSTTYNND